MLPRGRSPLVRLAAAHALRPSAASSSASVSRLARPKLAQSRSHAATRPSLAPLGVVLRSKDVRLLSSPARNLEGDEEEDVDAASATAGDRSEDAAAPPTPPVDKLEGMGLSNRVKERLEKIGITELFPVQLKTFQTLMEGKDIVVKARPPSNNPPYCGRCLNPEP
ncbi:hypothetical protein T484DRAFT_2842177 [Baffinella frigidus]|nr:hypothetical protein T484DRAFT_2842177 [Cryptophyta sp. CCMP2293]